MKKLILISVSILVFIAIDASAVVWDPMDDYPQADPAFEGKGQFPWRWMLIPIIFCMIFMVSSYLYTHSKIIISTFTKYFLGGILVVILLLAFNGSMYFFRNNIINSKPNFPDLSSISEQELCIEASLLRYKNLILNDPSLLEEFEAHKKRGLEVFKDKKTLKDNIELNMRKTSESLCKKEIKTDSLLEWMDYIRHAKGDKAKEAYIQNIHKMFNHLITR